MFMEKTQQDTMGTASSPIKAVPLAFLPPEDAVDVQGLPLSGAQKRGGDEVGKSEGAVCVGTPAYATRLGSGGCGRIYWGEQCPKAFRVVQRMSGGNADNSRKRERENSGGSQAETWACKKRRTPLQRSRYLSEIIGGESGTGSVLREHERAHDKKQPTTPSPFPSSSSQSPSVEQNGRISVELLPEDGQQAVAEDWTKDTPAQLMKFRCRICGAEFLKPQSLGGHMRKHYTKPETPLMTPPASSPVQEDKGIFDAMPIDVDLKLRLHLPGYGPLNGSRPTSRGSIMRDSVVAPSPNQRRSFLREAAVVPDSSPASSSGSTCNNGPQALARQEVVQGEADQKDALWPTELRLLERIKFPLAAESALGKEEGDDHWLTDLRLGRMPSPPPNWSSSRDRPEV